MRLQYALFFGLSLAVLILVLFYLWFSVNTFCHITSGKTKLIILLVLLFLTWSFPVSMLIERFSENFLTRGFYIMNAVWIGLLVHFLMATLPLWLIFLSNKFLGAKFHINTVAVILFSLAIVFTAYGLWNARHPVVKMVDIPIKSLPQQWDGKTVVQISDLHLGAVYGADFLGKIVDEVNALNPEAVFITGDLFDGMDGRINTMVPNLNRFKAKKGVYFITGNHETYLGVDKALAVLKQTGIRVLDDEIIDLDGIQLIGISYPSFGTTKDITKIIRPNDNFFPGKPSILLYHAPTSIEFDGANSQTLAYWKPDVNFSFAKNLGINLQLSGHAHSGQFFPFTLLTHLIYSGYDYGLHTNGNFSIYTTSGLGTWGPPLRTGNHPEIVAIKLTSKTD